MRGLRQITVIGLGLLGGSITLAVSRRSSRVRAVGFAHRPATRRKAKRLCVADEVIGDIKKSVSNADLVILATPISTFEEIFEAIAGSLPAGCIVTDVGSTKVLSHRWAAKKLPKTVYYVGSHPVAGSEQRGVEFATEDLFEDAACILTATSKTNSRAVQTLRRFWSSLGCSVKLMKPAEHDRIFANVSHLPHVTAAALVNATSGKELQFAGKGFIDTSRIASGPANIWADILLTNANNSVKGIDRIIAELLRLKKAIAGKDKTQVEKLLEKARTKRATLINYNAKKRESLQ